jgi:hypothetical protein
MTHSDSLFRSGVIVRLAPEKTRSHSVDIAGQEGSGVSANEQLPRRTLRQGTPVCLQFMRGAQYVISGAVAFWWSRLPPEPAPGATYTTYGVPTLQLA